MKNIDSAGHVTGTSIYLDDIPTERGTLFALPFASPVAHGKITSVDYSKALEAEGIIRIFTHQDIPGENQIGGIIPDEPLFAENTVDFVGMPIALIVGENEMACRKARELITIEIDPLPVITDPREARAKGEIIGNPRRFQLGDTDSAFANCAHVFEGRVDINGQEHLYIETQGAYARLMENGALKISSSTQGPTAVQKTTAQVLGLPMNKVEVDVVRLGGGFGGKEDQATPWAVMAALATHILRKPVKLALHRMDDMYMTGKRHPYSSDYKIGLDKDLKIIAYKADFYQNSGAAADLSPAVLERTLFHATNAYFVPNVDVAATCCRTNLPPNTAFRGFGGPQGKFVMESAIVRAAAELGVPAHVIQKKNLISNGDEFSYGQIVDHALAKETWQKAEQKFNLPQLEKDIQQFNSENDRFKKGLAVQPICFGISFTNTPMNNARALVHVYQDGSVGVSTGAVEMGQGVNTKLFQVACQTFGVGFDRVRIDTTNTSRVANTSPTAASAGADLNGKALQIACNAIKDRLITFAAEQLDTKAEFISIQDETVHINGKATDLKWEELVMKANLARIKLSEKGHYATPKIHFDKSIEKGHPFAYHVYGTAIIVVTVDCLRGRYTFDSVQLVHDCGKSMNLSVDNGQIEGGVVQGMGWMTLEEIRYDEKGILRSNALSTYKIPDIYSIPEKFEIIHLETDGHDGAIQKSKAVGEPPLMYGLGAYFAIQNAVRAFNPGSELTFDAPFTPEKVLISLYKRENSKLVISTKKQFLKN